MNPVRVSHDFQQLVGKTYTMFGPEDPITGRRIRMDSKQDKHAGPDEDTGIIPRAIHDIFRGRREMMTDGGKKNQRPLTIYCSFIQLYNEHIYDLLRDASMNHPLSIHEDREQGIYVEGLSEYRVQSARDCLSFLQEGENNRAVRATHMNQVSSRSHSVFQLFLERRDEAQGRVTRSKFNLVDLAGSEKWNLDVQMKVRVVMLV